MQLVLRIFNQDEMTRLKKLHNESLHKFYSSPNIINHHHYYWLDSPTWALAFPRSFWQLKYPAASSDFVTRVFSRVGLSAPRPTPSYPGGPMFFVRIVSLSRLVPILKRQDLAFCPCTTYPYKRCPGAITWTCMQRTW
jgi:hypothetical protein